MRLLLVSAPCDMPPARSRGVHDRMPAAVGASVVGRDEREQEVIIELGGVISREAARAHVSRSGVPGDLGGVVGQFRVDAAVGAGVVLGGEDLSEVVAELVGVVDREPARAVEEAHR
jgi:hypothetical protein